MKHIIITLLLALVAVSARADYIKGDVNKDGAVNIADVTLLVNIIKQTVSSFDRTVADVNEDGSINQADVKYVVAIILGLEPPGTETGDIDPDPADGPANAPKRK